MQSRTRNNAVAGFFVLATVVGFLAVVVTLSDLIDIFGKKEISAAFPLHVGTPGLDVGAEVTVGYVEVGRVHSIAQRLETDGESHPHIEVQMRIPKTVQLHRNARAELVVPLIGGGSTVNLIPGEGDPLGEGEKLDGRLAPPFFLTSSGIGEVEVDSIQQSINAVKNLLVFLDEAVEQQGDEAVDQLLASIESFANTLDAAQQVTADFQDRWSTWAEQFDETLVNVTEASRQAPKVMANADETIRSARDAVEEVQDILVSAEPEFRLIMENLADASREFREITMPQVHHAMTTAQKTIDSALETTETVRRTLEVETPQVSRAIGNMRIASNNLKLAMIEFRAQPWRLFYEPSEDEVREMRLHDSIRTYANAVSDLNAAAEALQSLASRPGPEGQVDQEALRSFLDRLEESFENYADAEETWFELLRNNQ